MSAFYITLQLIKPGIHIAVKIFVSRIYSLKIEYMKTILLFFAMALLSMCSSTKTIVLNRYSKEIVFFDHSDEYYENGSLKKCKLSNAVVLNGYECISWLHLFKEGTIKQVETAKDIKRSTFVIPTGSIIFLDEKDPTYLRTIWFSRDVKIGAVSCKGRNKIAVSFYPNGKIKACFLSEDQIIQGFPCKSSLLKPIKFHPNGKINSLTLSRDYEYRNIKYKKGETILIDTDM